MPDQKNLTQPATNGDNVTERIASQVRGLKYGEVVIRVHDGQVTEIATTERTRLTPIPPPRR